MIDGGTEVSTVHHRDVHGYYLALQNYFSNTQTKHDRSNSPRAQKARAKLLKLSASQFYELSTDVYDELQRRISEDETQPEYLLPRATFHMKRNQARQKLANLSHTRFNDLVDDILFEIKRRGYNTDVNGTERSPIGDNKNASNIHAKSTSNVARGSDGSNSQVPPTATIQASKVIPQKASIDWSSEDEEQDTKKGDNNTHVNTNSISKTPDADKHQSVLKDPKSKRPSTLQQPGGTPNLYQADSYYQYAGIIDSPGLNGVGNYQKGNENLVTESSNNNRDSNTFDFEGMVKDEAIDPAPTKSLSNAQKNDQFEKLSMEIEALKKENASLRQSGSRHGISSNKNFEEDLNSLSVEVGSLSVENEELKAKISELEFKLKNSESQDQISPRSFFGNGKKELEELVVNRESITRYAAEDGCIPFESVEEFHQYIQKLFADLQTEVDDIGHTLFEDLARLSHTLAQLFILVDLPEYKEEIILLKASLSHTITSIRYFAVFGALLPKITVQAAISELAFAFCNLVRSCKIKGDGRGGAALGPYKPALNAEKPSLSPQSARDAEISNSKFIGSFHRPTGMTKLEDDESAKDEMSPVKPLKLTQKANMSPNLSVPSAGRKPSNGLMIGPMIETKSPAIHAKNTPTGFQLNGTSPTISKPEGIDESLLARIKVSSQNKEAVSKNDPNSTMNDSTADKSMATSRATTADGTSALSSPPSTTSSNDHIRSKGDPDVKNNNDYRIDTAPSKNISDDITDSYSKSEKQTGITERTLSDSGNKKEQQLPSTSTPKQEAFTFRDMNHIRTPQSAVNGLESPNESKKTPEAIKDTRSKLEGKWHPVSHQQIGSKKSSTKQLTATKVEAKPKDNNHVGKAKGQGQQSQSQEEKSKKNAGKSFTEKLKNFATNAGIGLKVDKEQKDKQATKQATSSGSSRVNGTGWSKKSTSSLNSNGSVTATKVPHKNSESIGTTNDFSKTFTTASKKSSLSGGSTEGLNIERSIALPGKDGGGSNRGTDEENKVVSLAKLNTNREKDSTSIPSSDIQRVEAKSPASIGQSKEIPSKLPNFYFNNIPEAPPTNSNLTDKLKQTFADLPSEDENEGGSTNNSPYMSDSGSVFRSLKQSLKEEKGTTRNGSPLVQQQNFHDDSSEHREMPAGLGFSKETNMKFNNKTSGFSEPDHFSKPSFSRESQDHHSQSVEDPSRFRSKPPEELDDSLNIPGESVRDEKKESNLDRIDLNLIDNNVQEKEREDTSVSGFSHSDHRFYKKDENNEHSEDKSVKNESAVDRSAQSSNKSEYGQHVGIDSPKPARASGKTNQSSGNLNSDPLIDETRNQDNTSTIKVDNTVMPKLQPVKLYPSNNQIHKSPGELSSDKTEVSKHENSIKSPKIPKTPVMKKFSFKRQTSRTPSGKTPTGKTPSSARSPVMKSPGARSLASSRTDDAESFDVDAFDIENPDNTLSELLLYLEHQSLQVISTIQSLLTSIKEPHSTKGNLRKESNAINQVIRQMVDATSVSMNQSRNASLKDHGSWVVKSLEDCHLRVTTLCHLSRDGVLNNDTGDENHADKHFKQRLAGIAFDIAKCTKELVKTVEEASLREEIEFLNARLN